MKLSAVACPNCGGDLVEKNGVYICSYCGSELREKTLSDQEALLAALGEVKQEMLSNARRMLYDAVHAEDVSSEKVIAGAREVKKYISDDFMANFYAAACEEDVRSVNHFLERADVAKQDKFFLSSVCDFMLRSLEKRNVGALKDFIDRAHRSGIFTSGEYTKYTSRIEEEAEKLDKGVYDADLPRDVFIAYSSKDMAEVNELTDFLEGEGFSCFVALRNLRHGKGAAENYQRLLETAMRSCKSVVFISTGNSRDRSCDALGVELPYFRDHLPEIYRVEYRPASDNGKTTMGAKYLLEKFFENLEYARTPEDVLKRLLDHEYGFDKTTQAPAQSPKVTQAPVLAQKSQPQPQPKSISKIESDYDCFLCVKISDGNGGVTQDSIDAEYIYDLLQSEGYKPFYAERDLLNAVGADYDTFIQHALLTSRCMVVVCSNEEYLQSWLKNEYMQFLQRINDGQMDKDSIAIAYCGMPIEHFPGWNGRVQGIDLSHSDADQRIVNFVESNCALNRLKR